MAMAFYATFLDHDETASLEVLRRVPVTVVAATHDRLTPAAHGRRIAERDRRRRGARRRPRRRAQRQPHPYGVVNEAFNDLLDRIGSGTEEGRLTRRPARACIVVDRHNVQVAVTRRHA